MKFTEELKVTRTIGLEGIGISKENLKENFQLPEAVKKILKIIGGMKNEGK